LYFQIPIIAGIIYHKAGGHHCQYFCTPLQINLLILLFLAQIG
jgi:hypothetical protein